MEAWRQELYHHGIKGQRWGIRRFQNRDGSLTALGRRKLQGMRDSEMAYRKKLSNITKNRNADPNDVKRFNYRNRSFAKRVTAQAATAAVSTIMGDILTGKYKSYAHMASSDIVKRLKTIGLTTAANVIIEDALAKSASNRYTDSGKKKRGVKDRIVQKEDWIELGIGQAVKVAPSLAMIMTFQIAQANIRNAKYAADFEKWGQNILEAKLEDVVEAADFKVK